MDRSLNDEARAILRATLAWLSEWSEEEVTLTGALAPRARRATPAAQPYEPEPPRSPIGESAPPEGEGIDQARAFTSDSLFIPSPSGRGGDGQSPSPGEGSFSDSAPVTQTGELFSSAAGARPTLEQVREELGDCTRCGLCEGRTQIVFGSGNPDAALMFVGEGPGEQEDREGLPFVGRAGELLTKMIESGLGIPRADTYICNIVKCRPPANRTPLPDEVARCRPFLDGQIQAVQPRVIVALGKPASSLLLGRDIAITRLRGQWQDYQGIPLMPTFHPAFVLRRYTNENRRLVWQDLQAALERSRA